MPLSCLHAFGDRPFPQMSPQHSTFEALYGIPYLVVNGNPPNETYLYEIYLNPKLLLHQHG
jgi:hypothetical protein